MSTRPATTVVVAGTGTEVGKTWVGCALATRWRAAALAVAARKPAQSFEPDDPLDGTDAALLAAATGEAADRVCPPRRWYPVAMAPPMAADALGRDRVRLADLVVELDASWDEPAPDIGVVELAGGLWSPIAHDGSCLDLTGALRPDTILVVADAGLGTINAVRPAVDATTPIAPTITFLNRFDATDHVHRANLAWLREVDGLDVVTDVDRLAAAISGPG